MASVSISCPSCSATDGVVRNGKSTAGHQRYLCAVLIGGATPKRALIVHVLIGTFLFQGIMTLGLPVVNQIIPEGNLSEVMRMIISNGIIIYALTQAKGGDGRE